MSKIKKLVFDGAILFTLIALFLPLVLSLFTDEQFTTALSSVFAMNLLVLLYCALYCASGLLFNIKKADALILRLVHFLINGTTLILCVYFASRRDMTQKIVIFLICAYSVLYWMTRLFIMIIKYILKKKKTKGSDYIKILSDKR